MLTNVRGRTSVLKHSVITTSDIPVHQKPYQITHALRDVKKELMAMVEAGIVDPSVCVTSSDQYKKNNNKNTLLIDSGKQSTTPY